MIPKKYAYSYDEENFHGELNSPEEASEEAFYLNGEVDTIWVGEIVKHEATEFINGGLILETIQEEAYEQVGEWVESWLEKILGSKEKIVKFEKLIAGWIADNDPIRFFNVKNVTMKKRENNEQQTDN